MSGWGQGQWGGDPWGGGGALEIDVGVPSTIPSNGGIAAVLIGTFVDGRDYHVFVGGTGTPEVQAYSGVRGRGYVCRATEGGSRLPFVTPANLRGLQSVRVLDLVTAAEVTVADVLDYIQPPGQVKIFLARGAFPRGAYPAVGRRRDYQLPIEDWQT